MMTVPPDIPENRRKVIDYLRKNPEGYQQIQVQLKQDNSRCAVGMCGEALNIRLPDTDREVTGPETDGFYLEVEDLIDYPPEIIYLLNDHKGMNFSEIADELERRWFGDHSQL